MVGAQPRSELCAGTIEQGSWRRRGHRAVAVAPWGLAVLVWRLSVCSPRHSGGVKDTGAARVKAIWAYSGHRATVRTASPAVEEGAPWRSFAMESCSRGLAQQAMPSSQLRTSQRAFECH